MGTLVLGGYTLIAIGLNVLSQILGHAILMHLSSIDMEFSKVLASAAVGNAILAAVALIATTALALCCLWTFDCGEQASLDEPKVTNEVGPSSQP